MSQERNPAWYQDSASHHIVALFKVVIAIYLGLLGYLLSILVINAGSVNGLQFISGIMPILLLADFILRFALQNYSPLNMKPYLLLPIQRRSISNFYVLNSISSSYNFVPLPFFFVYGWITILPDYGFLFFMYYILIMYLLLVANNLWHLIARSLIQFKARNILLPIIVYAVIGLPLILTGSFDFNAFCIFYAFIGEYLFMASSLLVLILAESLLLLYVICRRIIGKFAFREIQTNKADSIVKSGKSYKLHINSYIQLELLSVLRNKRMRNSFTLAIIMLLISSAIIGLLPNYGDSAGRQFWLIYGFGIFAETMLVRIMGNEGNYIEFISTHSNVTLKMLKGKYYFYSAMELLPILLFSPWILNQSVGLSTLVAYPLFTVGPVYCFYFQLAVYNNQTISGNKKLSGKNTYKGRSMQSIFLIVELMLSWGIILGMLRTLGASIAEVVMASTGIIFIATHHLWLRNIYKRMKKRKYQNIESFIATRG